MASTDRRRAIKPTNDDMVEEIREISNPIFSKESQEKEEIDRYTVLLPKSKFKKIRMMAVVREVPVKIIFEEMLDEYLANHQ